MTSIITLVMWTSLEMLHHNFTLSDSTRYLEVGYSPLYIRILWTLGGTLQSIICNILFYETDVPLSSIWTIIDTYISQRYKISQWKIVSTAVVFYWIVYRAHLIPNPSNSLSMILLCSKDFNTSSTMNIKLQVLATACGEYHNMGGAEWSTYLQSHVCQVQNITVENT